MILDSIFLLEAGLMRLVDDDQAEIGVRKEQRGAGADDDPRLAMGDRPPGAAALRLAKARMPGDRFLAEAGGEALQERLGQCDFGEQDQDLPSVPKRLRDRFEIGLGLARAGHAVEQEGGEVAGADRFDETRRRGLLRFFQQGWIEFGVRSREGIVDRDLDRLDRAHLDQPADHPVRNAGDQGELADQPLARADPLERLRALRRQPAGDLAGRAIFGDAAPALQRPGRRQRHAQDRGDWRQIIIGGPFDQPAKRRGQRRRIIGVEQGAEAVVADLLGRQPLRLPDRAQHLARAERRDHDRTGPYIHAVGHAIVERPQSGVEQDDADSGHGSVDRVARGERQAAPFVLHPRHCERSEAIQSCAAGLPRRS
jgi:hypothetical protein